jgi:hypothetical protein
MALTFAYDVVGDRRSDRVTDLKDDRPLGRCLGRQCRHSDNNRDKQMDRAPTR